MNEFIVFDEDNFFGEDDRFYTILDFIKSSDGSIDFVYNSEGELKCVFSADDGEYTSAKHINFKTFNYVGKKDIDGNKIYGDCSIFEFDFQSPSMKMSQKRRGVFTFDDIELRYEIDIYNSPKEVCFYYNIDTMSNFKIIGTVQQNPELLKEKK